QAIGQSTNPPAVGDKAATPAPARASGVTTTDTTGIAKAFASGPTRLTDAKNTAPSGNMATLAAHCVAIAWRHQAGRTPAAPPRSTMAPTAAKDNQKPADSGAQGSETTTTAAASASTSPIRPARPEAEAQAATASIQQVRCAGIPQPLKRL